MKKILITGVTGFAGQYLAELLLISSEIELHGTYHSPESKSRLGGLERKIILHQVDLTQQEMVLNLIKEIMPDEVYNLAAQTSPGESMKNPSATLMTNTLSELYLFESLRERQLINTRVLAISSAEVYGAILPDDLPIDEDTPLRPASPYAVSKITQDYLAFQYFISYKIPIIRIRPFNHIGPRQQPKFVLPMFAKQIAEIEKGTQEAVMKVGNLEPRKDFSDVRDVVKAYALLMEKGEPGEVYNVGSGKSTSVQEMLTMLLSYSEKEIKVEIDQSLYRPTDAPEIVCDFKKAHDLTGWKPTISLSTTLKDTLDYFRKVV